MLVFGRAGHYPIKVRVTLQLLEMAGLKCRTKLALQLSLDTVFFYFYSFDQTTAWMSAGQIQCPRISVLADNRLRMGRKAAWLAEHSASCLDMA